MFLVLILAGTQIALSAYLSYRKCRMIGSGHIIMMAIAAGTLFAAFYTDSHTPSATSIFILMLLVLTALTLMVKAQLLTIPGNDQAGPPGVIRVQRSDLADPATDKIYDWPAETYAASQMNEAALVYVGLAWLAAIFEWIRLSSF